MSKYPLNFHQLLQCKWAHGPWILFSMDFIFRLDAIACDAELQEKSQGDLKRLGEKIWQECETAMLEYKAKLEDPTFCCKYHSHSFAHLLTFTWPLTGKCKFLSAETNDEL
jgi:hypothetical protein